jgi:hypothetical protein
LRIRPWRRLLAADVTVVSRPQVLAMLLVPFVGRRYRSALIEPNDHWLRLWAQ